MKRDEAVGKAIEDSLKRKYEEKLYKPLDDFLKRLKKKIKEIFAPLYVSGFDELNIIRLSKITQEMYDELDKFNRENYLELVKHARSWAEWVLGEKLSDTDMKKFIDQYLKGYDPVTQYVYTKEVDRKRMRLNEAIATAKEFQDMVKLQKAVKKAADLWFTQSSQYGLDLMDFMIMESFLEDDQVEHFRWVTVGDEKVCSECNERDGKIWPSDSFPSKPHYNCRCFKVPAYDTVNHDPNIKDYKES